MLAESLALSAVLFTIGVVGVLTRRNAIILFMCVELMLNAVNLSFVALSKLYGATGQVFVIFVMTVAAAEAAVGLAIIIAIFRHRQTVHLDDINLLKGSCIPTSRPAGIPSATPSPPSPGSSCSSRSSASSRTGFSP